MQISSKLIERAVDEISSLPGIGKKTALRLVLHLIRKDETSVNQFANSIIKVKKDIKNCSKCNNLSDDIVCSICNDHNRLDTIICVVEDIRDVMAIESTGQFRGKYHVLGGVISPMDGVGPSDLFISTLADRIKNDDAKEILLALNTTMEGETTSFYIFKKLRDLDIKITTIARGVAIGDELEYTDEITLGRSIINRTPYKNSLAK